jgi:hypothetical protein
MAAALAASLPAPTTASAAPAPTYEAIPASMAKVIDIEADLPLTSVQLDGLVCSRKNRDACYMCEKKQIDSLYCRAGCIQNH